MNKILTLYNLEFKRIYKLYIALIGMLFASNLLAIAYSLNNAVRNLHNQNNLSLSIESLKTTAGFEFVNNFVVNDIYIYTSIALGISVAICLVYAICIWYRDYFSKSKTIYTLLSLPQQRFNIYIAKLITILVMIYGVTSIQFLFWFIDLNIVKLIVGINSPSFTNIFTNMMRGLDNINIVSPYIMEFLMINVVGVIVTVIVIFTGVLIERSYKKVGAVLGVIYIWLFPTLYFVAFMFSALQGNLPLVTHIIYFILVTVVSIVISYTLINKRVYI